MRRHNLSFLAQLFLSFSFVLSAGSSGALGADRFPPPDKDPQAPGGTKVSLCHRRPDGRFSLRKVAASAVPSHLAHGDCFVDDQVECTSDSCDGARGCLHTPSNSRCIDDVDCTVDTCNTSSGCVHTPDDSRCPDDGDACTADRCAAGSGCENDPITPCCGNGTTETDEECDDDNTTPGDGCDENCQSEAPANNDCGAAEPISNGTTPFDNTGATSDGPAVCGIGSDIWYHYTAPCTGTVTIDTFGSGFDTVLVAYEGCTCPVAPLLACDDDSGPDGVQSVISFAIVEGNCYKIQVGGYGGLQGSGVINVDSACCGDGSCDPTENDSNCPADCGCAAPGACGGQAPAGCWCGCEDVVECEGDNDCCVDRLSACDLSACPFCGDGTCDPGENTGCIAHCETDCGPGEYCGDGDCNCFEDAGTCPADCGCAAPGACGGSAPAGCWCGCDCFEEGDPVCCPDASVCRTSCPYCGNGICDGDESDCFAHCDADCGPLCGDGNCNCFEDKTNCPSDCIVCGDGTIDPGEECDDSNTTSGDGCDATCQDECNGLQGSCVSFDDCCDGGVTVACSAGVCCGLNGGACATSADCCAIGSECTGGVCMIPCRDLGETCSSLTTCCDDDAQQCGLPNPNCGGNVAGDTAVCCVPTDGACEEDCDCCGLSFCFNSFCVED